MKKLYFEFKTWYFNLIMHEAARISADTNLMIVECVKIGNDEYLPADRSGALFHINRIAVDPDARMIEAGVRYLFKSRALSDDKYYEFDAMSDIEEVFNVLSVVASDVYSVMTKAAGEK